MDLLRLAPQVFFTQTPVEDKFLWIVPVAIVAAVAFAIYLAWDVMRRDKGTEAMQNVAGMIYEGAVAFLKRQYGTIGILTVVAGIGMGLLLGVLESFTLGWHTMLAFWVGALCSALAGIIGMYVAVQANVRTASAAQRSIKEAINVALRGGAVSGFLVVALSLLGVFGIFWAFGGMTKEGIEEAPFLIVGFGFGASFVALFAQLGGGIYTKAADVGADLVGKVEAGIPEDDPRNPAVIADLVGDNVGDCAGRGADLFESTAAENIGAMILGVAIYQKTHDPSWIFFPLVVRAIGLFASMAGIVTVGLSPVVHDPMATLNRGYWVMTVLAGLGIIVITKAMLGSWWLVAAGLIGLATSVAFVYITQYYTAGTWRPVQEIARASKTGPATNIISGFAVGLETTAVTAICISIALGAAFFCGKQYDPAAGGLFGTAVATMGMLTVVAYILAMDTFGPITDNAGGIVEMSKAPEETRKITDALDAVGNTTKALTKGYAVGSAALAAFLLFSAYLDKVKEVKEIPLTEILPVDLSKVDVFIGGFLGAMLVFLFSSLAIRAVGRAAGSIIEEVRSQFRSDPGIMAGTSKPNFASCVDITARSALREMIAPGLLVVLGPILVGILLGYEAEAALLMVGTIAGILMATVLNNGGGAWDNAKKFIEAGFMKDENGNILGKGSDVHKAAVVGDTVGDPFKDTAGPSLHVLIKLLSTITLVLAPLFI